jgi:Holliday junction resolvasome RuvABC ATP-dependent DNA helicase subunit
MSDCDVVTTALESDFQRGNVPSPTRLAQLAAGHLEELTAAAESFIYVNLISPFLGSTRQWLEELTQENPHDNRIGVLKPLLDRWTTIQGSGGLKEADYRCFIAELSEISERHPVFFKSNDRVFITPDASHCETLLDVQRGVEELVEKRELQSQLRKLQDRVQFLRNRFEKLRLFAPITFQEFVSQSKVKERLEIAIEASRLRQESLPHVLLVGPYGIGKRTLAEITAISLGVKFLSVSAAAIRQPGDLFGVLIESQTGAVIFVEDVERMRGNIIEYMLPALTGSEFNVVGGKNFGVGGCIPCFTLVGATTRAERLPATLLSCFSITAEFTDYTHEDLVVLSERFAIGFGLRLDQPAVEQLARHSNGTPHGILHSLKTLRDYAAVKSVLSPINAETVVAALGASDSMVDDEPSQGRVAIPSSVRTEVWRRDGGKCVKCGSREKLEYDHIIPISKGGSNTARNIELLCESCNRSKSDSIQ